MPFGSRLLFAWACFFRVLFDGRFAARAFAVRDAGPAPVAPAAPSALPPIPPPADGTAALQLLSLLQREGRLVDFIQQDIASFPDADVGVAARVVHEGCRKALGAHATLEPVRSEDEGTRVTLAGGFDANEVKLVGEVRGAPPYTGILRHRGWRARRLELPSLVGDHDPHVLAPAEVELG
jgi:hypothetical protein